jgi:hypothetical protein
VILKNDYTPKDTAGDAVPAGTEAIILDVYRSGNVVVGFANGAMWNDITPEEIDGLFVREHE